MSKPPKNKPAEPVKQPVTQPAETNLPGPVQEPPKEITTEVVPPAEPAGTAPNSGVVTGETTTTSVDLAVQQGGEIAKAVLEATAAVVAPVLVAGWRIIGPAKGRWRAKRHFGPEPVVIPSDELSEADLAAIQADPELMISES